MSSTNKTNEHKQVILNEAVELFAAIMVKLIDDSINGDKLNKK